MEKTINLSAILIKHINNWNPSRSDTSVNNVYIEAMREACNQVLDMAAEEAEIELRTYNVGEYEKVNLGQEVCYELPNLYIGIDKESILNVKKQVI